ncbi:MAG: sulfite exporter TauE/SafE family protein [Candidatus Heimdallarchaeaceae archaeon]
MFDKQKFSKIIRSKYVPISVLLTLIIIIEILAFTIPFNRPTDAPVITIGFFFILLLVGLTAGFLGGIIGTGGCSVMLPILHFWLGYPAPLAIGTTLFAVIFTAISGGYGHFVRKNVDKRTTIIMGGAGIVGVILGSWLFKLLISSNAQSYLGLILGIVFVWPSVRMIWEGVKGYLASRDIKKNEEQNTENKQITQKIKGNIYLLALFGFVIGIVTGIVGLGGGYALVPGLIYLFSAPVYITMGTSLAIMIPLAITGGIIKIIQGYVVIDAALLLAAGTIIGAQIGAAVIKKIKPFYLKLIFGFYFIYVSLKFIFSFFGISLW